MIDFLKCNLVNNNANKLSTSQFEVAYKLEFIAFTRTRTSVEALIIMSTRHKIEIKDKENNIYYQNNPQYFDELIKLVEENPIHYSKKLNATKGHCRDGKTYTYLKNWINSILPQLSLPIYLFNTKIYWIFNNLTDFPKCYSNLCHNKIGINKNVENIFKGYSSHGLNHTYCSIKCAANDAERKNLFKQTCLSHFGYYCPFSSPILYQMGLQTIIRKYGVYNVSQSKDMQLFKQKNSYKKYGVKIPLASPEIRSRCHLKYFYDNRNFDSKPELALYIWLKDHNINFIYQPKITFTYFYNNIEHKYIPDFKVEDKYLEIKGIQFLKDDGTWQNPYNHNYDALYEAKHQCVQKNNIKILYTSEYQKYIKYIEDKYGKNYLKQFKIKNKIK